MFSSNVFDYINVLGSTADAAATRLILSRIT